MQLLKPRNTIEKGKFRYIIFEDDGCWFGVALEFNLVVEADNKQLAFVELANAVDGYLTAARKGKMRPTVLNQDIDPEYSILWKELNGKKVHSKTRLPSNRIKPEQVYASGIGMVPQPA